MSTNLRLDPKLIELALELSGEKTKKAAITLALREFIARRNRRRMLELFNSLDWEPSDRYKAERTRP